MQNCVSCSHRHLKIDCRPKGLLKRSRTGTGSLKSCCGRPVRLLQACWLVTRRGQASFHAFSRAEALQYLADGRNSTSTGLVYKVYLSLEELAARCDALWGCLIGPPFAADLLFGSTGALGGHLGWPVDSKGLPLDCFF